MRKLDGETGGMERGGSGKSRDFKRKNERWQEGIVCKWRVRGVVEREGGKRTTNGCARRPVGDEGVWNRKAGSLKKKRGRGSGQWKKISRRGGKNEKERKVLLGAWGKNKKQRWVVKLWRGKEDAST